MKSVQSRVATGATVLLGLAAIWRAGLAAWHYRASLRIMDDPSARELRQLTALIEVSLAVTIAAHAALAAYLIRRPLRIHWVVVLAIAGATTLLIVGSFQRVPVLGMTGLQPVVLTLGGAAAGYLHDDPWVSAYLGAAVGGVAGFLLAVPSGEWMVALAVTIPPVMSTMVGVIVGRIIRRVGQSQRAA